MKSIKARFAWGDRAASGAVLGIAFCLPLAWGKEARAATVQVTSNAATIANDGVCTLREAIRAVNNLQASGSASGECVAGSGSNDLILLMPSAQTYTVTNSLVVNRSVSIAGSGPTQSIISSNQQRIFDVQETTAGAPIVNLTRLAIQNSRSDSNTVYGVYFNGNSESAALHLTDVKISNCTNGVRAMGGSATDSSVQAWDLVIQNSRADGFYCQGCTASLERAIITGSVGSGVRNRSLSSEDWPNSHVNLNRSSISDNGSTSASGGGLRIEGGGHAMVQVVDSTIWNNRGSSGGGIYSQGGRIDLWSTTISSNTAVRGGGIYIDAEPSGSPFPGENNILNTTIAKNTASTRGGGLYVAGRQAMLYATILGDNVDSGSGTKSPDCWGPVAMDSDSINLIETNGECLRVGTNNPPPWWYQGDLALGALIDTGASPGLKAHFPLKTSPVLNILWSSLEGYDQRGMRRPEPRYGSDGSLTRGLMWDAGAIEFNTTWHPQDLLVHASSGDSYTAGDVYGYFRFSANAVGDYVTFAVPISEAGTYDINAHVGKMRENGNYQLEYANSLSGPYAAIVTQDFYSSVSVPLKTAMTMGTITIPAAGAFTPGLRYFRFRVLGKAATSLGYRMQLAYLNVAKR
jgi:hypothetical protein